MFANSRQGYVGTPCKVHLQNNIADNKDKGYDKLNPFLNNQFNKKKCYYILKFVRWCRFTKTLQYKLDLVSKFNFIKED